MGPKPWAINHLLYAQAQIEHGTKVTGYGYWGFSPSNNPAGGYREYGVDMLGTDGPGYTSDQERADWKQPYDGCGEGERAPTEYGEGVVTPHASFLALRYAPCQTITNPQGFRDHFDAYGPRLRGNALQGAMGEKVRPRREMETLGSRRRP